MALIGTMVRWYRELPDWCPDVGHIPVSNLYEVFVLFCWMTAAFYLYYEDRSTSTRALGAFVMLVVSAAVGFLLWYTVVREAHEIQPLVPALKSWWMKLHVPANFIGYGTFALAAMVAFAYLIKQQATETRWYKLAPLWLLGVVLCFEPVVFRQAGRRAVAQQLLDGVFRHRRPLIVAAIVAARRRIAAQLPSFEVLDDVMYKSIAVGFAFFTIATMLGALWAAEAWGGYWSWDPKETWALIVWLNYAAWLHMRLMKGLRGTVLGLVGAGGPAGHLLCLPGREHVPVGAAQLRRRAHLPAALRGGLVDGGALGGLVARRADQAGGTHRQCQVRRIPHPGRPEDHAVCRQPGAGVAVCGRPAHGRSHAPADHAGVRHVRRGAAQPERRALRLAVPWKYGFKSGKSIVKIASPSSSPRPPGSRPLRRSTASTAT
jgi:cytochrome c-type biogenesis protein CcsB